MITSTWKDPETGRVYECHHNGDFSGEVKVTTEVSGKAGDQPFGSLEVHRFGDSQWVQVEIPFGLMKALVAEWVAAKKISALEDADEDEVLLGWT